MINRMQGESIKEYKIRLCKTKEELKSNLTWEQVKDLINKETGDSYSESVYRKWWKSFSDGLDYAKETQKQNVQSIDDIESKKERVKLQDQRRELNKLIKNEARFDNIKEEIVKAIDRLSKEKPLIFKRENEFNSLLGLNESALILSDWHKGLFARNYWNKFDNNEFNKRLLKLIDKTMEYNQFHNVNTMHVFTLGDLVNGLIHVTTKIESTEDVISQTMSVAEALAEMFVEFSNNTELVKIYFCRGNHDRVTANKNDEIARESFADIILWYLKSRISHIENIVFVDNKFDDEIIHAEICGKNVLAVHGHRDKPSNVVSDLSLMTKIMPDYVFMGHYHHHEENEIQGVEVIINSSLSGVDSYAKDIRRTSKPAQKLLIFNPEEGRLCSYNIRLDI